MPGMEIKLVPLGEKTEVRYRGPNITPGYWRAPGDMASHFDEEGFFCTGDAVQWGDTAQRSLGLRFDGRTAEDFKLTTGLLSAAAQSGQRSSPPARPTCRTL